MAVRIPLVPWGMEANEAYLYLVRTYTDKSTWEPEVLVKAAGRLYTNQLLEAKILIPGPNRQLRMSFDVLGTVSNVILRSIQKSTRSYRELLAVIPVKTRSSEALKHHAAYLCNFRQIQYFTDPSSAQTYFCLERQPGVEDQVDELFELADRLEPQYQFQINPFKD